MSGNDSFILCGVAGGLVLNYVVHESGHLLGAALTGLRVRGVVLFGHRFGSGLKGIKNLVYKNAVFVKATPRLWRLRFVIFLLSGPAANIVSGVVAADQVSAQSSRPIKDALAGLALVAISFGLLNLVPRKTIRGAVSDGRKIYELIRYGTIRSGNPRALHSFLRYRDHLLGKADSPRNVTSRQHTHGSDPSLVDTTPDALVKLVRDPVTPAAIAVRAALVLHYSNSACPPASDETDLRMKLLQREDVVHLIAQVSQRHQNDPDDQQVRASLGIFSLLEGNPSRAQQLLPCLDLDHHPSAVRALAFAVRALAEIELSGPAEPARSFAAKAARLNPSDVLAQLAEKATLHTDAEPRGLDASPPVPDEQPACW